MWEERDSQLYSILTQRSGLGSLGVDDARTQHATVMGHRVGFFDD